MAVMAGDIPEVDLAMEKPWGKAINGSFSIAMFDCLIIEFYRYLSTRFTRFTSDLANCKWSTPSYGVMKEFTTDGLAMSTVTGKTYASPSFAVVPPLHLH